jgi:hypothetical protein
MGKKVAVGVVAVAVAVVGTVAKAVVKKGVGGGALLSKDEHRERVGHSRAGSGGAYGNV